MLVSRLLLGIAALGAAWGCALCLDAGRYGVAAQLALMSIFFSIMWHGERTSQ